MKRKLMMISTNLSYINVAFDFPVLKSGDQIVDAIRVNLVAIMKIFFVLGYMHGHSCFI